MEENIKSIIPNFYAYQSNLSEGTSFEYKDKPNTEKGWILFDNFSNLGERLIESNNQSETMTKYLKYIPAFDDIKDFTSDTFLKVSDFVDMYIKPLEVELDEDIIWPYHWPINI